MGRTPWHKGKKLESIPLTSDEAKRLIQQPSKRAKTGIRNAALLAVLYRSGLRTSEALALLPADVDAENGLLRIRRGKGGKGRTVVVDTGALALVARWIDKRAALPVNGKSKLFVTLKGRPLNSRYVRAMVARLGRKAGITSDDNPEKRCHPHALRHSCASELSREGKPLAAIRDQLGHQNISTTSAYIARLSATELSDAIGDREWE